jgi:hypothetical protein
MKIGIMSLWNAANGASIHAELVGRAWVKQGHKLRVFSARKHPDARSTSQPDEDYVARHFAVDQVAPFCRASSFDPTPLLDEDYEVFVAENVERLPAEKILELFPIIKKKAITINVVHEPSPPIDPLYYRLKWNAIVCFDHRYKEYLTKFFPQEIIHVIPYPYHVLMLGNKIEARGRLNLPLDKKIIFSFGIRARCISFLPPILEEVNQRLPLRYIVVAHPESKVENICGSSKDYEFMDLQVKSLPLNEVYDYLHAADVHLIHRELIDEKRVVVSSTVFQTLGSGCPILFNESRYVEQHGEEISKYKDAEDLKVKLEGILKNGSNSEKIKPILERQNSDVIAQRFIELFRKL